MKKILFILILCNAIFLQAKSQNNNEFIVSRYEEINGISTKSVTDILQGSQGYLWLASYQGLIRFDGYSFENFTNLPGYSNSIVRIAEDKQGFIWLALSNGTLAKFNPANASFTNIDVKIKSLNTTEKPGSVQCIFVDSENVLWLGITRTGLVKVDVNTGNAVAYDVVATNDKFFTPEISKFYNRVMGIYEDEHSLLWLATPDGLYTFNKETLAMKQISRRPKKYGVWREDNYRSINRVGNKLWLGSWGGGLCSYNPVTDVTENFKFDEKNLQSYTHNIVNAVIVKTANEFFIASADKGFMSFNAQTKKFTPYSHNPKYSNIPSWLWDNLIYDKEGNMWAVNEFGLMKIQTPDYKFQFKNVAVTKTTNSIFYEVFDLLNVDNLTMLATEFADGLHVIDNNKKTEKIFAVETIKNETESNSVVRLIKDRNGVAWILTRDFLYYYDKKNNKLIKAGQPELYQETSNVFSDFSCATDGNLFIASLRNGFYKYNIKTQTFTHFFDKANSTHATLTNLISSITTDSAGRIWVSSNRGYLSYFNTENSTIAKDTAINKILAGLYNEKVFDLFVDSKGFLWVTTLSGLIKIDCSGAIPKFIKKYCVTDGLHSEFVAGLAEDKNGNIWGVQSSIYGVCMIDQKKSKIYNYGIHDGINHSGNVYRIKNINDSTMWLMCQGGYYEFKPASTGVMSKQQNLVVTIMAVNSIDKYYAEDIKNNNKIILKPTENSFYFEFAAIAFSRPESYQYAYKLEGFDKNWTYCGSRRSVSYTNIPGGDYVFKIKATTVSGYWNSNETSIPFHINIPFYLTWWFMSLVVLAIMMALYSFYSFRLKQQEQILSLETKGQRLEKEKTRVQYENLIQHLNPHFLFNSLASLGSLIRTDQKLAISFLDGMSKIYRYILKSKDEELVNLKDEINFIQAFVTLQNTRFDKGLQVHIHIPEDNLSNKIVPVTLQNLIENAMKHNIIDEDSPLVINILIEDDYLLVRNNLQKKNFVETSNNQGLDKLQSLYRFLSKKPLYIVEDEQHFTVKIPLI